MSPNHDPRNPAHSCRRIRRRRLPAFHPVPARARTDGWTPERQADFIGWLAQTGSVQEACAMTGMGREGAYRLRRRPGASGFAAAWDAALGKPHLPVDLSSAKATGLPASYRSKQGLIVIVMYQGRYRAKHRKVDNNALLQDVAKRYRDGAGWIM